MKTTLKVTGMMCAHCVRHVTEALQKQEGVEKAEVSLEKGTAEGWGTASPQALVAAVQEAGYEAELLS